MDLNKNKNKNLKKLLTLLFIFVFIGILVKEKVYASEIIVDNFDTYTAGQSINGQGGWITVVGTGFATTTFANSIPNSVSYGTSTAVNSFWKSKTTTYTNTDTLNFTMYQTGVTTSGWTGSVRFNNDSTGILDTRIIAVCLESATTFSLRINMALETENCSTNRGTKVNGVDYNKNEWVNVTLSFTGTNENFLVTVNGTQFATEAVENIIPSTIGFSTASKTQKLFFDNIGLVPPDGIDLSHVLSITPNINATTTSPVTTVTTYWTGEDLGDSTPDIKISIHNYDTGYTQSIYTGLINTTRGLHTITAITPSNLANGYWEISNYVNNSPVGTWFNPELYPDKIGSFIIGTTTIPESVRDQQVNGYVGGSQIPMEECGITNLSGCFKNAIAYLFYPSLDITNGFKTLELETRAPFVYAYQINELRQELFTATPTGTTTIGVTVTGFGTLTFLSKTMIDNVPFSSTIKTIVGFLLYILMAEYIYNRVKRIHDKTT